jgi:hypothetical protein
MKQIFQRLAVVSIVAMVAGCISMPDYINGKPSVEMKSEKSYQSLIECNRKWLSYRSFRQVPVRNGIALIEDEEAIVSTITDDGAYRYVRIYFGKIAFDLNLLDSKNYIVAKFAGCS